MSVAIGIDFGGTNTKLALVKESGEVIRKDTFPTRKSFDRDAWIKKIEASVGRLTEGFNEKILGMGIGVAGLVDPFKKIILQAPNIKGIDGWEIGRDLGKVFSWDVEIDNDVNAMALGEYKFGGTQQAGDIVCLTLGTGVGGGIILDGKLYRGSHFMAGELGHITINENGPLCNCGNHGCLEAYVGNQRIVERFKEMLGKGQESVLGEAAAKNEEITPRMIYDAAKKGDKPSYQVWEEVARHLGTMLAGVINLLDPDRIVLGGGVANALDIIEKPLRDSIHKRALKADLRNIAIERSRLGDNAGIIGAASLIFSERGSR